ncbi:ABC transporter ATP-binding protein [Ferruginibacter albus]|uniref:ABC transporter ATP-binding protein n=1 Tax=Ferruginibacter albus TaxID=2875540 RepID=UPI001CC807DB|nr:ABC transporter ATP-binding protein [Ferruginibacter albus]UAY50701.1 ATP-binding cassette domain-containing protein [Ferruginibacter albus]
MSSSIIKVENLSKQYRLGQIGTGTFSHDINRWWYKVRGKEDPYLKIGEANDRTSKGTSEYVWALNDINFEVEKGEVLGVIGRNGAGKSTLLKILSRTTTPSIGSIKIKGRIASLLEVGTGFHPELSGRDNIFLNGAILGMTKTEIKRKFDEIVDFAGVERYIDTPVKRYSSGMYVRLAFGVAAHLEPEILIVDEVLAVGDAEFQKKALGKMKSVSNNDGRTVLFVSHNMAALETLCSKAILLENGSLVDGGAPSAIIKKYISNSSNFKRHLDLSNSQTKIGNENIEVLLATAENGSSKDKEDVIDIKSALDLRFIFINKTKEAEISVGFDLRTLKGDTVFGSLNKGTYEINKESEVVCHIPGDFLNSEVYQIFLYFHTKQMDPLFSQMDILTFEIKDTVRESGYLGKVNGFIRPILKWEKIQ